MKVKNYLTDDKYLILNLLEKELCKREISYVRIDNEVHFEDKIVRIYDFDDDYRQVIKLVYVKLITDLITEEINCNFKNIQQISFSNNQEFYNKQTTYQPYNKSKIKYDSKRAKQLLKRYK